MSYFYTVFVASAKYHGNEDLTYSSAHKIQLGSVVLVPMQSQAVLGVVTSQIGKPHFKTKAVLKVYDLPVLPSQLLKLARWLQDYYPAPLGMVAQQILPASLQAQTIIDTAGITDNIPLATTQLPPLTTEQTDVLTKTVNSDTYVLHGDTGSGKTRVYIELAVRAVTAGKSSIILTPEIGLTSQLAASFRTVFGDRVIVAHSQLTPKARQQSWLKIIKSTQPLIIIGPRSAVFSPVAHVGLIVVDESHEPAYKQEQAPHYHAVRVASQLAYLHGASVLLGSATPSIVDYFIAKQKHKPILRMQQLAASNNQSADSPNNTDAPINHKTNKVLTEIVDLKDRTAFSRSQYLSNALLAAVDSSLQRGEQSLLYLNRRGTARVILCNVCGWQAMCPHCDLPLTYHHDLHILQCHSCGFKQITATSCPECGNTDIVFKVIGTKAIEAEIRQLYPNARIMRFDTDNKKADRFEQHFSAVRSGDVDILIGTQLLAKGLDLPRLSTLGVIIADTSLTFPDYSAEERTYQLLAQVIGRVGRGHRDTYGQSITQHVIVQSYAPKRPVITAALAHDWDNYYKAELHEREAYFFPPFSYLLKLTCRRATSKSAEKAAERFYQSIEELRLAVLIEGPMPSFHSKVGDKFEWQLVVKTKKRSALLQVIKALPKSGWSYDIDPANLL